MYIENKYKVGIILLMILCRFIVLPVATQGHYASNINMYDLLHEYILDASGLLAKFCIIIIVIIIISILYRAQL